MARYFGTHDFTGASVVGISGGSGGAPASGVTTQPLVTPTGTIGNQQQFVALSGTFTANLPASPEDGQFHYVKDIQGIAGTSGITIDGNGALIDGEATYVLSNDYESATVVYMQQYGGWFLI
jgi:hypothetical protein